MKVSGEKRRASAGRPSLPREERPVPENLREVVKPGPREGKAHDAIRKVIQNRKGRPTKKGNKAR